MESLYVIWVCSLPAAVVPGGHPIPRAPSPGVTQGLTASEVTPSLAKACMPLQ